jgi:hypothetical protein
MKWWQDNSELKKREYVEVLRLKEIFAAKIENWQEIVQNDLEEGIQYRFVTNNAFNAISVLSFYSTNYKIEECVIAVYRMNLASVNFLKALIRDRNIKSMILLSDFFRENKRYERWCHEMIAFAQDQGDLCQVGFSRNHAKVFCAKTSCGKHIVFEGSGNLSDNSRIEQYILEQSEKMYNFHKTWITDELRSRK